MKVLKNKVNFVCEIKKDVVILLYNHSQKQMNMKTHTTYKDKKAVIDATNTTEILVGHSLNANYLQLIDNTGKFREFQIDYHTANKLWYEFKTSGRSDSPTETPINYTF